MPVNENSESAREQGAAAAMGPSRTAHFLTVSSTLSSSNLRYHVEGA